MHAQTFWKTVVADHVDFLAKFLALLEEHHIRFCVLGGQGVNAYVEPVVSLDLDLVVALEQLSSVETILEGEFRLEHFPHSMNVSTPGSDLRIQIQTDPRYFPFVDRASQKEVLGVSLPVAALEDILQGKIWAIQDPEQRPSKRQKDLADVARITEAFPELRGKVPSEIIARLV